MESMIFKALETWVTNNIGGVTGLIVILVAITFIGYKLFIAMSRSQLEVLYIGEEAKHLVELANFVAYFVIFYFFEFILPLEGLGDPSLDDFFVLFTLCFAVVMFVIAMWGLIIKTKIFKRPNKGNTEFIYWLFFILAIASAAAAPGYRIISQKVSEYIESHKCKNIYLDLYKMDILQYCLYAGIIAFALTIMTCLIVKISNKRILRLQIIRHIKDEENKEKNIKLYVYSRIGNHIICGKDKDHKKCENYFLDFNEEIKTASFKYYIEDKSKKSDSSDGKKGKKKPFSRFKIFKQSIGVAKEYYKNELEKSITESNIAEDTDGTCKQ